LIVHPVDPFIFIEFTDVSDSQMRITNPNVAVIPMSLAKVLNLFIDAKNYCMD
jgi:hypothetical protein